LGSIINKKANILETTGNVVVEDGKQQFRVKKAKIRVNKGRPEFEFEK
jgi:hypothetical protein